MTVEGGSTSAIGVSTGGGRGGVATASPVAARGGGVEGMSHAVSISPDIKVSAPKTDTLSIKFGSHPDARPFAATLNSHNIPLESPSPALKDTQKFAAPKEGIVAKAETKPTTDKPKSAMKVEVWNPALKTNPSGKESTYKFSLDTNKGKDSLRNLQVETRGQKTETPKVEINLPSHLKTETGVSSSKVTEQNVAGVATEDVKASVSEALPQAENPAAMPETVTKNITEMKTEKVEEVTGEIQALKGEVVSTHKETISPEDLQKEYIKAHIEPKAAPNEKGRMAVEKVDRTPKVKPDGVVKDGRIKIDATISPIDLKKTNIQGVRLYEAIVAYQQSVGIDTPENKAKALEQTVGAMHFANERTGTEEATIQAYEMSFTQDENVKEEQQVAIATIPQEVLEGNEPPTDQEAAVAEADVPEVPQSYSEVVTYPDELLSDETQPEEERQEVTPEVQIEALPEEGEITPTTQQGSTLTQQTTNIQDDFVTETIIKKEFVEDEQAQKIRRTYALGAAQVIFDLQQESAGQGVTGAQIVSLMPSDLNQPEEVQSEIIKGIGRRDGSYTEALQRIKGLRKMATESEVDSNVTEVFSDTPPVKVVTKEQQIKRPVTDMDVQRVFNAPADIVRQAA